MKYLKGALNGKAAYLCGAIKACTNDGIDWREEVTKRLIPFGVQVLNPCKKTTKGLSEIGEDKKKFKDLIVREKWGKVKEDFWPIVRSDLRNVDRSDFIVFYYDPDIPTIGSVHELVISQIEKKPILIFYKKQQLQNFNPWICVFIKKHHFFSSLDKMFKYLEGVNHGKFDTSLWVI